MDETGKDMLSSLKPSLSRRSFLKAAATAVASATLLQAVPRVAEGREEVSSQGGRYEAKKKETEYPWEELRGYANDLIKLENEKELKVPLREVRDGITFLERDYEPYLARLQKFLEEIRANKNDRGEPVLVAEYRKFLGKIRHFKPEEVVPFFKDTLTLDDMLAHFSTHVRRLRDEKRDGVARHYWEEYNLLHHKLENLLYFVGEDVYKEEKSESYKDGFTIALHPDVKLKRSGSENLSNDMRRVSKFIEKFPFFRKLYSKIYLYGPHYGELQAPLGALGWYSSVRQFRERQPRSEISIDMSIPEGDPFEYDIEIVFAHEAFGHATDVALNRNLANRLSIGDLHERLLFQQQILNNPDWGNHDDSISSLFRKYPAHRGSNLFITTATRIKREEFMGIITEYPRNVILHNNLERREKGRPITICDVADHAPDGARIDSDAYGYKNFSEFLHDYLPKLQGDAQSGNIRSKIILWGVENFGKDFGNLNFLWRLDYWDGQGYRAVVPSRGWGTAREWSDFCNIIVVNAVMYHAFLNGIDEIRGLFSDEQSKKIESRVLFLRKRYRSELWAEGVAYSHYFGGRLEEDPPYRVGLEHVAAMIDKRR